MVNDIKFTEEADDVTIEQNDQTDQSTQSDGSDHLYVSGREPNRLSESNQC